MAKLAGGVAVIKVGAATEVEMKEKKARVEDALHATRAAVEEGIVAGGGVAYLRARANLKNLKGDNPDQEAGIKIVLRALEEPMRQIVQNAGDEPSVVVNKVVEGKGNFGFNAATGEYGDLVAMGVVDPTKVARFALQNAASVASLMLTTEAMVAESPKDEKPMGGGRRHGRHGWNGRHGHVTVAGGRTHSRAIPKLIRAFGKSWNQQVKAPLRRGFLLGVAVDDSMPPVAQHRTRSWNPRDPRECCAWSVQRHAKDAAEESRAVVLLLDAAVGNMPNVSRHFVAALLAEGESDAEVLVELECGRKLTVLVDAGFGDAD